jgi:hypothetical protein
MHRLQTKLLRVKDAFRTWNKSIFGDVNRQIQLASQEVMHIQNLIDSSGIDANLHMLELQAQMTLMRALKCQDQFCREKARNQSFIHGDRNTAYFYRMSRIKSAAKTISLLLGDQVCIIDPNDIETHVVNYYQGIFGASNECIPNELVAQVIPSLVTMEENNLLTGMPLFDEKKRRCLI